MGYKAKWKQENRKLKVTLVSIISAHLLLSCTTELEDIKLTSSDVYSDEFEFSNEITFDDLKHKISSYNNYLIRKGIDFGDENILAPVVFLANISDLNPFVVDDMVNEDYLNSPNALDIVEEAIFVLNQISNYNYEMSLKNKKEDFLKSYVSLTPLIINDHDARQMLDNQNLIIKEMLYANNNHKEARNFTHNLKFLNNTHEDLDISKFDYGAQFLFRQNSLPMLFKASGIPGEPRAEMLDEINNYEDLLYKLVYEFELTKSVNTLK